MDKHHTFSIKQVADMTGLSKQVIRKWEDRYAIITPERLDNGYRVYTQQEVDMLKQTYAYTLQGYSIKHAAVLAYKLLQEQVHTPQPTTQFIPFLQQLEQFGSKGDDVGISNVLQQIYLNFGVTTALNEVAIPFLKRIGDLWFEKTWSEYQEAIASAAVRDFLIQLRRTIYVPTNAPLIVGSCLPYERHENPMHILLLQCMLKGYRTIMLGSAPAPHAIESTVLTTKPQYVLLTGSTNVIMIDDGAAIRALDAFAATQPNTQFYIGGQAISQYRDTLQLKHLQEAHSLQQILE